MFRRIVPGPEADHILWLQSHQFLARMVASRRNMRDPPVSDNTYGMRGRVSRRRPKGHKIDWGLPTSSYADIREPDDRLCTEWKVSLAFTVLTLVSLLSTFISYFSKYPDAFSEWCGQLEATHGVSALPRPPRTPPPPWTPSESLRPLLPQDRVGTPSELEAAYDTPDGGPNSVEDYRHKADDLEKAVNGAGTDADGYTNRHWWAGKGYTG
ncbi:hypothetical protein M407DRAFT_18126 [Tulasnella calospora MUT 4182]|uniref:Uncharacterized protein n=1 Tax=Tulasnella calospora MUT 4182 TaxID=1051891 RepID=A0A0C3QKE3_9AGAM|nr:hypothetical protein M407DRAFT_18126 [Tulasnella calospora MUT 4182]